MPDQYPKTVNELWDCVNSLSTLIKLLRTEIWGYDPIGLNNVKIAVDASGNIKVGKATDEYQISDIDGASPAYYGFLAADGRYFIMKKVTTALVKNFTYSKGTSGYATAWTNRGTQTYNIYSTEF